MALFAVPPEILEHIALDLVLLDPLGPRTALQPLRATCKTLHHALSPQTSPALYARIFTACFDSSAVDRRLFSPSTSQLVDQLRTHYRVLDFFSSSPSLDDPDLTEMLFHAMLMLFENDGKNLAQLEWAGLYPFLMRYLHQRLWGDSHGGWPAETDTSSCALWVLWMMTTDERLRAETEEQKQRVIDLVLPFVLVPFRYCSAHAPASHFNLPLAPLLSPRSELLYTFPHSILTAHGPYPLYRSEVSWSIPCYTSRTPILPPPISIPAKLLYFSRRELIGFGIPPHLPQTRSEAMAIALANHRIPEIGPTQEDIEEFNRHKGTKLVPLIKWDWWDTPEPVVPPSVKWDNDYFRMRYCHDVFLATGRRNGNVYTPGMLNGLWQGRMLIPSEHRYMSLITDKDYPPDFNEHYFSLTTVPVYMRLREHHFIVGSSKYKHSEGDSAVRSAERRGRLDDGMRNAWFPDGTTFKWVKDGINVHAPLPSSRSSTTFYETYSPTHPNSHDPDLCPDCIKRREEDALLRKEFNSQPGELERRGEALFRSVGLGRALRRGEGSYGAGLDINEDAEMAVDSELGDIEFPDDTESSDEDEEMPDDDAIDESEFISDADLPLDDPRKAPPCLGIRDIIIEGETDLRHGQAWNHFVYRGRVRSWDGLVGILRISRDRRLGDIFFYGYIVGGQNFVGNWRIAHADASEPAWESAFSMSKRED